MTTNSERLNRLAKDAPDELTAWLKAEHVETDGWEDSREKLVIMPYHNGEKQAKLMGKEFDQVIFDEFHTDEPDTIRNEFEDNGCSTQEPDSREKLEADCTAAWKSVERIVRSGGMPKERWTNSEFFKLLDRQAAITERHWLKIVGASANANIELKRQIDELTAQNANLAHEIGECMAERERYRHVKPRTLEDVLTEMLDRNSDGVGYREFHYDYRLFISHYADEIRELMGGEAS